MDVLSRSLASAAGLLLLLLLAAVVGEYESAEAAPDVASHRIHVLGIYYRVRRGKLIASSHVHIVSSLLVSHCTVSYVLIFPLCK